MEMWWESGCFVLCRDLSWSFKEGPHERLGAKLHQPHLHGHTRQPHFTATRPIVHRSWVNAMHKSPQLSPTLFVVTYPAVMSAMELLLLLSLAVCPASAKWLFPSHTYPFLPSSVRYN